MSVMLKPAVTLIQSPLFVPVAWTDLPVPPAIVATDRPKVLVQAPQPVFVHPAQVPPAWVFRLPSSTSSTCRLVQGSGVGVGEAVKVGLQAPQMVGVDVGTTLQLYQPMRVWMSEKRASCKVCSPAGFGWPLQPAWLTGPKMTLLSFGSEPTRALYTFVTAVPGLHELPEAVAAIKISAFGYLPRMVVRKLFQPDSKAACVVPPP